MLSEYHLTAQERRVAQSVIRGEIPHSACARLSLARSRYRILLRHLYRKTGSRDQIELIAKLRTPRMRSDLTG